MRRSRYDPFRATDQPRWLVLQDIFRTALAFDPLPPGSNLRAAMTAKLAELQADGWRVEGGYEYGFVFIRRGGERRELGINAVDPTGPHPVGHGASFTGV